MDEIPTSLLNLRPLKSADLPLILRWRNHPNIRQFMYSRHEISFQEHCNWFEEVEKNPNLHALIYEADEQPVGFASVKEIIEKRVAEWGFYLAPGAVSGTGSALGISVLDYAFFNLGIHKLCGEVIEKNERSINFHLKLGFTQEGLQRDQYFDGTNYRSIVHFGLLSSEWTRIRKFLDSSKD